MHAMIVSLAYQPISADAPAARTERVAAEHLTLIAGYGIAGDRKAGRHPKRHLNVLAQHDVDGIDAPNGLKPGQLGEQVIIAGLDVASLPRGTRLQLGEDAVIEITMPRAGCDWLERLPDVPRAAADGRLGVMARVIAGGEIAVGDRVTFAPVHTHQTREVPRLVLASR